MPVLYHPGKKELPFRLGYRPELDGLRGLAILFVVVGHATPWLPGGWLGVDLFFVLSGFLITTLLLEEWQSRSSISLREFYIRRALRLLPALFTFLVAYSIVVLLLRPESASFRGAGVLAVVAYVSNWVIAFQPQRFPLELQHMWSLSVEEQFYLLWPLLLAVALARGRGPKSLKRMLVIMIGVIAVWRAALVFGDAGEIRLYFGTDTRMDELFFGCLLAVMIRDRVPSGKPATIVGATGLSFLALMAFFDPLQDEVWSFLVGIPLIAVAAGALVWAAVSPRDSILKRALRSRGLVFLGLISYPLYLWHTPINVFALNRLDLEGPARYVPVMIVSVLAAITSYYVVESRFLAARKRFQPVGGTTKAEVDPVDPAALK